jgi:hypothetical protein
MVLQRGGDADANKIFAAMSRVDQIRQIISEMTPGERMHLFEAWATEFMARRPKDWNWTEQDHQFLLAAFASFPGFEALGRGKPDVINEVRALLSDLTH